jgi:hypothetical protein
MTAAEISTWGMSGSNGGQATFNASGEAPTGSFVVDNISTAPLTTLRSAA